MADLSLQLDRHHRFEPLRLGSLLRPGRLPGMHLLADAARSPWRFRPLTAALTLVHDADRHIEREAADMLGAFENPWPSDDLWICATRRSDAHRVVFGHEASPAASLPEALAASCAVPGYFAPVVIDGRAYLDGGAHSATNADVLGSRPFDLVVALSPMSAAVPSVELSLTALVRLAARRRLHAEARGLEHRGIPVVMIEPEPAVVATMGTDLMSHEGIADIVREAFLTTGGQIARTDALAPLADSARRGKIA